MTTDEIEALVTAVKAGISKTAVQVYNNEGKLCSFFKEDVIDVLPATSDPDCKLVRIKCSTKSDSIIVIGSLSKWRVLLNFNPLVLNADDVL